MFTVLTVSIYLFNMQPNNLILRTSEQINFIPLNIIFIHFYFTKKDTENLSAWLTPPPHLS